MASWKENMSRMAQSAMQKSKEMAEVTKLNLEISNCEQRSREIYIQLGEYLSQHPELLPAGDETVQQCMAGLAEQQEKLEQTRQAILEVKNINICPGCGAEVSRSSRFCDRCGTEMVQRPAAVQAEPVQRVCSQCGEPLDSGALFCGNCGAKQEQ